MKLKEEQKKMTLQEEIESWQQQGIQEEVSRDNQAGQ